MLLCLTRRPNAGPLRRGCAIAAAAAFAVVLVLYRGQLSHYNDVIEASLRHARGGQLAYLFGTTFTHARWYFYPAVAAVKTPIGVFLLLAVTLAALIGRRQLARDSSVMLIPAAVYAAACIASPFDLEFGFCFRSILCFTPSSH